MQTKKRLNLGMIIAMMTPFICANLTLIVTPALADIAAAYPHIPYNSITFSSTISSLFGMPAGVVAGAVAGRRAKYKTVIVAMCALIVLGGVLPMLVPQFALLLVARALVGFGCGALSALGYPLILAVVSEEQATKMTGVGTTVMNIAGVGVQLIAGVICRISLNAVWLSHLVTAVFAAFVIIFLKENRPGKAEQTADDTVHTASGKRGLPLAVFFSSIGLGLLAMALYPIVLNISAIVTGEGLGDASVAGTLTSLFFLGGILSGFLYAPISKATGRFIIPVLCGVEAVGMLVAFFGHNVILLGIGEVLVGVCHYMIWPAIVANFNTFLVPEKMSLASGILSGCLNGGMFLTSPFLILLANVTGNSSVRLPLLAGAIIIAVIMVIWFFVSVGKKQKAAA